MEPEQQPNNSVVVVMVPLTAQSHLNKLLQFAKIISSRGVPVYYMGSTMHNRQAKDRVHGWDPSTISNIHFHDCQLQLPQVITPHHDLYFSKMFPLHLLPILIQLREPLSSLLRSLSATARRVVVVHDSLMSFAAEEASLISNVEAYYCFHCVSVFALLYLQWEAFGKPIDQGLQGGDIIPRDLPRVSFEGCFPEDFSEYAAQNIQWSMLDVGNIYNSCYAIEGRFLDLMAQHQSDKMLWAIGPTNPVAFDSSAGVHHKCLEWLDKQPQSSVVYVSFGTTTSLSDAQIATDGLDICNDEVIKQRFIWVLRDATDGLDICNDEVIKAQLPNGFEERTKRVGMIVREWAPQLQILAHSSTGGFLSHCGWNSCMESLSMGVPIAAWPMHSDQPRNTMLVTEVLKVGLVVLKSLI
ncbi:Zeatin o-glucosyltransferase [Thalictrum thalictroides]|uniref:Glycosyltransferase n=1 Tax=Thalictrum thalictroides TaxID=46969 RepID=A0A7J6WAR0_THATH|nr:Zeatin o-glucosyltransferase [Thalictrum thalictroides]